MKDLEIDRIEVITVGPPTERLSWAIGMEGQFMTQTILRLTTRGGLVGFAGAVSYSDHGYESSVAETLRSMLPELRGASPLAREAIWERLVSRTLPRAPQAQSLIDVALWDLAAKAANLPLYKMLGGARDAIAAYASTPLMADVGTYVDEVARLHDEGFRAFKFHCWCEPSRDLQLVESIEASYSGSGMEFMLDVEQRYTFDQALRVGRRLQDLGYVWFEAPLDDFDLRGYQELTRRLDVPIIPAGNSLLDARLIGFALAQNCWRRARTDVMVCGGLTPALKIMALAASFGTTVELQCWNYTLGQAANLHLMLGQPNSTYFEQPPQFDVFEFGSRQGIRPGRDGMVRSPDGPGLGVELDEAAIARATIDRYEIRA